MKIEEKRHGETTRQYAYRTLRGDIISSDSESGAPFNDVEISQMIGISHTPVREAIIQLSEKSRIIEILPQRGMYTALIDIELAGETCFPCLILEKVAMEPVCSQADEEDLRWLDENIGLQGFYLEGGSSQKPLELDNKMYWRLSSIYHKEFIYETRQGLAIHYDRIHSLSVVVVKDHKIIEDHKKLLGAIWRRDKKQAVEIMELHLNRWMSNEQMLRNRYPAYFK